MLSSPRVVLALVLGLGAAAPAAPADAPAPPSSPLATVDGQPITREDVMKLPGAARIFTQQYALEQKAVEEAIAQRLLAREAAARGVPLEQLQKAEIEDKAPEVGDAEAKAFYEANKAAAGSLGEEEARARVKTYLRQQRLQERRSAFVAELRARADVKVLLEPPRVAVSVDDDPALGPATAPVTIVEFSDYQCPYCSRAEATVRDVLNLYGDRVRMVFRDMPLPMHPNAPRAAEAATCAGEQGRYWQMHDALFAHQDQLDVANLKKRAGELGLDQEKFDQCLDSGRFTAEWRKDAEDAKALGVEGTPAFFINGRFLNGARPAAEFWQIVDDELQRAGLPVPPKPAPSPSPAPAPPGSPAPSPSPSPQASPAPGAVK